MNDTTIFKETMSNLKRFEEICNRQGGRINANKEDSDFVDYFEFKLAESLLKELGNMSFKVAKHILVDEEPSREPIWCYPQTTTWLGENK